MKFKIHKVATHSDGSRLVLAQGAPVVSPEDRVLFGNDPCNSSLCLFLKPDSDLAKALREGAVVEVDVKAS